MANRGGLWLSIAGGVDPNTIKSMRVFAKSLSEVGYAARGLEKTDPGRGLESTIKQIKKLESSVDSSINSIIGNIEKYKRSAKELSDVINSSTTTFKTSFESDAGEAAVKAQKQIFAKKQDGKSDDLKLRKRLLNEYIEDLGDSNQAQKEAIRRANELTDQLTRLYRSLHEVGAASEGQETLESFVDSVDIAKVRTLELEGSLKKTRNGFQALNEEAREALGVDKFQFDAINSQLMRSEERVDSFLDRLKKIQDVDLDAFDIPGLSLYGKSLKELESTLKRMRNIGDITPMEYDENIRKIEELQFSYKQYKDDLKELSRSEKAHQETIRKTAEEFEYADAAAQELRREREKAVARDYEAHDAAAKEYWKEYRRQVAQSYAFADAEAQAYWEEYRRKVSESYDYADAEAKHFHSDLKRRLRDLETMDFSLFPTSEIKGEITSLQKSLFQFRNSIPDDELRKYNELLSDSKERVKEFTRSTGKAYDSLGHFGRSFAKIGKRMQQFGAFVIAAMAVQNITQAVQEFIQVTSQYDQALHNLQAILDVTASKSQVLGDNIQQVAEQTKFSAVETAEGVQTLGQAGLSVNESINALQGVTDLATGTMSTFASVADLATTTLNAFGLEAVESSRVADVFANAINNSKASVDKLTTSFNYVGAAGHQAGLSLNEVTGVLMTLYDNGLRASTAGTGLRRMLLKMINPSDEVKENISGMNMSLDMLNPKIVGMEQAFSNLIPLLWDAERGTVNMRKASDMFGTRAAQVASVIVEAVGSGNQAISGAIEKTHEMGSASQMAATQLEGLELKIKNLTDRLKNIGIAIGDAGFTEFLKDIVDVLRFSAKAIYDFIKANEELVKNLGWAGLVTVITSSLVGLYQVFQKLMMTGKLTKLFVGLRAAISSIFVPAALSTGLVIALDKIISSTDEAIDRAQKLGAEFDVLNGQAETWADSLEKAFGTSSWDSTVKNLRKAFEDVDEEHKNLVKSIEQGNKQLDVEGIGFKVEDAVTIDQVNKILDKIEELREASWEQSMQKNAESLAHVSRKVKEFSSAGIDLEGDLKGIASEADIFTKSMYSINEAVDTLFPKFDSYKATLMDVFGKSQQEVLKEYEQSIESIVGAFEEAPDFDNWGVQELQERIDNLFESVRYLDKENFVGRKLISEIVFSRFSELKANMDAVTATYQKQQKELENHENLTKEQQRELAQLQEKTVEFESTQNKVISALKEAIINGTEYASVNEILKNSLPIEEYELFIRLTKESSKQQEDAIDTTFALANELEKIAPSIAKAYSKMSPIDKMSFSQEMDDIREDLEDYRTFLINKLGKSEKDANDLVLKEKKKRIDDFLKELKESSDEAKTVYEQWSEQISNAQKQALLEVEEGSIEALRIREEYAKKELEVARRRHEDDPTVENYGKLLDAKKNYADSSLKREEKLTEDILDEIDDRIDKINRRQDKREIQIEAKVLSGDLTEAQAEVDMAKNNLETEKKKIKTRQEAIKLLKEEEASEEKIEKAINAKKEAELSSLEASNELKEAKLNQIDAIADRENSLAELRRDAALAGIKQEQERWNVIESNRAGVMAYAEKEKELAYNTAKAKLEAEKEYRNQRLQSMQNQLIAYEKFYGKEKARELYRYKEIEQEKIRFARKSDLELINLERQTAEARIRAHGSLWEKTKLGLDEFTDRYKRDTKTWSEHTADAAMVAKNSWNSAFSDFILGTKDATSAFKSFASSVIEEMANVLAQSVTRNFIGMVGGLFSGGGGGGATSAIFGSGVSQFATVGTNHGGGLIGKESGAPRLVDPEIFNGAKRLHDGLMGLTNSEYPAILQKGEVVFTQGQLSALGDVFKSATAYEGNKGSSAPKVEINLENKSGKNVDAKQKDEPKWDGEKYVLNVVLDAVNRNRNNFGKNLKGSLNKA